MTETTRRQFIQSTSVATGAVAAAPMLFSTAARELGLKDVSYQRGPIELFDGRPFNTEDPIDYLNAVSLHRNFSVAEIPIGQPRPLGS